MDKLVERVCAAFAERFGAPPALTTQAPGRVNLIGEHTDYNDGFVLPMAIGLGTAIAASPRDDGIVNVIAVDMAGATTQFSLFKPILPNAAAPWSNYVRGVADALQKDGLTLSGADLLIAGNLPQGAGLSSSASLEMAAGLALVTLAGTPDYDKTKLALAGQYAEHHFAGCNCGIMDQLVSARGQDGHALLIDCRSLEAKPVRMPDDAAVMIVHSGIERGLVDGEYNLRRLQCEAAAKHYGVRALRDLDEPSLAAGKHGLDLQANLRARHVVTENARTLAAAHALEQNDLRLLGKIMAASHASMRDDFAITVPKIDNLVAILQQAIGPQGGARMTGGGFGGAVVGIMPQEDISRVRAIVEARYRTPSGALPPIMIETASRGATHLIRTSDT